MLGAVLLLALLLIDAKSSVPGLAQEEGQTLTLYAAVCPIDYAGDAFFADCYDNPGEGFGFDPRISEATVDRPTLTDETGYVNFDITDWTPGTIAVPAYGPEDDFYDDIAAVYCVAGGEQLVTSFLDADAAEPIIAIEVPTTENVQCDLYFVPHSIVANSVDSDSAVDDGGTGVTVEELPDTGIANVHHANESEAVPWPILSIILVALAIGWRLRCPGVDFRP
jgi:hypothetical protein